MLSLAIAWPAVSHSITQTVGGKYQMIAVSGYIVYQVSSTSTKAELTWESTSSCAFDNLSCTTTLCGVTHKTVYNVFFLLSSLLWVPVSGFHQAFWRLGMASLPRLLLILPLPRTLDGMCHGSRLGWALATCVIHVATPYSLAFPILFLHKSRELWKQGRPGNAYHMNDVSWTKWRRFPSRTRARLYGFLP